MTSNNESPGSPGSSSGDLSQGDRVEYLGDAPLHETDDGEWPLRGERGWVHSLFGEGWVIVWDRSGSMGGVPRNLIRKLAGQRDYDSPFRSRGRIRPDDLHGGDRIENVERGSDSFGEPRKGERGWALSPAPGADWSVTWDTAGAEIAPRWTFQRFGDRNVSSYEGFPTDPSRLDEPEPSDLREGDRVDYLGPNEDLNAAPRAGERGWAIKRHGDGNWTISWDEAGTTVVSYREFRRFGFRNAPPEERLPGDPYGPGEPSPPDKEDP